ncbi:MAG: SdrD B-like domain-containing protein, partial [Pseudomonadota bacterium]
MSTFTIRISSSATNPAGTAYGEQPDQGAPSYFDVVISGSSDSGLPNGVYDGYCLNPQAGIQLVTDYSAQNYAGNTAASYVPIGFNNLSQAQVDQINWLLSQNFTSDAKYAGQFNYGEVQTAIWKLLDFSDASIAATPQPYLTDNGRNTVSADDVSFLVSSARAAVASGNGVLPTDAFFSTVIDPAGNVQPLIIQLQNAKLGNFVWEDIDRDGVQDANEAGVDRVVVELYDGTGKFIASTITGDDFSTAVVEKGYYQFAGLKAGDYQVKFIAPSYAFTVQDANGNTTDAADSDADAITGLSQVVTLAAGQSNQTVDAGLVAPPTASLGDRLWVDADGDGQQD